MLVRALAVSGAVLLSGCSGALAQGDGRAFGDDLGRFHVKAQLDSTSCGADALGTPAQWEFDVVLSQKPPTIYWNTGADAVEGALGDDGRHFSFSSETVTNVGDTTAMAKNVCTIVRKDASEGDLDQPSHPASFRGTLEYDFSPEGQGDCSAAMTETGLSTLPCTMTYSMTAEWVSDR